MHSAFTEVLCAFSIHRDRVCVSIVEPCTRDAALREKLQEENDVCYHMVLLSTRGTGSVSFMKQGHW